MSRSAIVALQNTVRAVSRHAYLGVRFWSLSGRIFFVPSRFMFPEVGDVECGQTVLKPRKMLKVSEAGVND